MPRASRSLNLKGMQPGLLELDARRQMIFWMSLPARCQMQQNTTVAALTATLTVSKRCSAAWLALLSGVRHSKTCHQLLQKKNYCGFFVPLGHLPNHRSLWSVSVLMLMTPVSMGQQQEQKNLALEPTIWPGKRWSLLFLIQEQKHRTQR